jgi:hypothetical protein
MKYRVSLLMGMLAISAGAILQAQDYDDIYYDASKSTKAKTVKVTTPAKTIQVYGEVPEKYKVAVQDNYIAERDVDEYNRRGAYDPQNYEPQFEVDINGDTIYFDSDSIYDDDMFANTRRIERFYNPDVVILSSDDDLVELYYDESPTINLIVGSDWGYASTYGWNGWYNDPWYYSLYDPWYNYYWDYPWSWGWHRYSPFYSSYWVYSPWHPSYYWGYRSWWYYGSYPCIHEHYYGWNRPHNPHGSGYNSSVYPGRSGIRAGLATNRNGRGRVSADAGRNRNGISARGANGNRTTGVGQTTTRTRSGYAGNRGLGNINMRDHSVGTRSGGASRTPSTSTGSGVRTRSHGNGYSSGGYSGGSRRSSSSGGYSSGSTTTRSSSTSYSSGSSSNNSGSFSSGGSSRGSSGGGSHGGSSGGGGRRR